MARGSKPCGRVLFKVGLCKRDLWLFWEPWSHSVALQRGVEGLNAIKEQERFGAEENGVRVTASDGYHVGAIGERDVEQVPWISATARPVRLTLIRTVTVPIRCTRDRELVSAEKLASAWKKKLRKPYLSRFRSGG